MSPIKANPGGQIPIEHILGRDELIARFWRILERKSIVLTSERRIGKTSVIKKMEKQPLKGWFPLFQDLEQVKTVEEFAYAVYTKVEEHLRGFKKLAHKARDFLTGLGGTEVGGLIKLPEHQKTSDAWKRLLRTCLQDLLEQRSGERIVFLWDEFPYMIDSIQKNQGHQKGMEILDEIRSLRQDTPGKEKDSFRVVLTGSIGLHHVLDALKEQGYSNEPINDLELEEVPPLDRSYAKELATRLIQGEKLATDQPEEAATWIAQEADCVPFYIHNIIWRLSLDGRAAKPEEIRKVVQKQIEDGKDPWQLRHYRDRVKTYYPKHEKEILTILDVLAVAEQALAVDEVLAGVKTKMAFSDRDLLLHLLRKLCQDHYLTKESNRYEFRFSIIKRWWKQERDLT